MPNFGLIRHKIISVRKMIMPACVGKAASLNELRKLNLVRNYKKSCTMVFELLKVKKYLISLFLTEEEKMRRKK